jgi:hypothetical protein
MEQKIYEQFLLFCEFFTIMPKNPIKLKRNNQQRTNLLKRTKQRSMLHLGRTPNQLQYVVVVQRRRYSTNAHYNKEHNGLTATKEALTVTNKEDFAQAQTSSVAAKETVASHPTKSRKVRKTKEAELSILPEENSILSEPTKVRKTRKSKKVDVEIPFETAPKKRKPKKPKDFIVVEEAPVDEESYYETIRKWESGEWRAPIVEIPFSEKLAGTEGPEKAPKGYRRPKKPKKKPYYELPPPEIKFECEDPNVALFAQKLKLKKFPMSKNKARAIASAEYLSVLKKAVRMKGMIPEDSWFLEKAEKADDLFSMHVELRPYKSTVASRRRLAKDFVEQLSTEEPPEEWYVPGEGRPRQNYSLFDISDFPEDEPWLQERNILRSVAAIQTLNFVKDFKLASHP